MGQEAERWIVVYWLVRPCGSEIIFTTAFKASEKFPLTVDIPGEARALY